MLKKSHVGSLVTFRPAVLKKNPSRWYIEYYALHPELMQLKRVCIKLNHIENLREREKFAKTLIQEYNQKLYTGWNPFMDEKIESGKTLKDAMNEFLKVKSKEIRPDSVRTYVSQVKKINEFLSKNGIENINVYKFDQRMAIGLMNYFYNGTEIKNRTYNNILIFVKIVWKWMIENGYATDSPFKQFKKKITEDKARLIIPREKRSEILAYFKQHDQPMYICSLLVFHTLIRPKEITFLKPEHFNYKNQTILVPAAAAKNRNMRISTIPNVILQEIIDFKFNGATNHEYIFGKDFKPGTELLSARRFSKQWDRMRTALKLPIEYQLYSLRDSGITQLIIDGVTLDEVMKLADHSSLNITSIYLKYANPSGSEQIKQKSTLF